MAGQKISKEIKEELLQKIRSEGITGAEAARRYGINVKNIYRWLSQGLDGIDSDILLVNKLKRENKELKEIIGKLMLNQERGKKN